MFCKNNSKKYLTLVVVLSITTLISCKPRPKHVTPSPPPPTTTPTANPTVSFSTLSEKEANCENDLRKKMDSKLITLTTPNQLANNEQGLLTLLAEGNSFLKSDTSESEYKINKNENNEITAVGVDHRNKNNDRFLSFEYSLSRSNKDTYGLFELNVGYIHSLSTVESDEVEQTFLVNDNCELKLTETKLTSFVLVNDNLFEQTETSFFIDGGKGFSKKTFEKPTGVNVENVKSIEEIISLPTDSSIFFSNEGIFQVENISVSNLVKNVFGIDTSFESLNTILKKDGNPVIQMQILANKEKGIYKTSFEGIPNYENWVIPKAIWDNLHLAKTSIELSSVKADLPSNYFSQFNSVKILSSERPQYENFDAYWKISNEENGNDEYPYSAILTENRTSNTSEGARVTPEDLISNDTIQTEIPEIKEIANEILQKEPTSRVGQITLILDFLSKNYVYDYEMLKNNVIRPLSTSEALNRKTGVCQHYAVIFTSIARALNIPTRIIFGYHLGRAEPGAHAWVESEVSPGVWQAIEPQNVNGLTMTYTRYYFPIVRATFLEDKDSDNSTISFWMGFLKNKIKLLPNN